MGGNRHTIVLGAPLLIAGVWLAFGVWRTSFVRFPLNDAGELDSNSRELHNQPILAAPARVEDGKWCNFMPSHDLSPTNIDEAGGILLIHSWFEGSKLFPGYELLLKGFLASQDLNKSKFVQWITLDWRTSEDVTMRYIADKYGCHPNIEFRVFDKERLVKGTCWEHRPEFMEKTTIKTYGMRDYSNVVRWLLIYNYGGVWLDADSIPLVDLTVLHEFHPRSLVVGHAFGKDRTNKEDGMFNNNILLLTDKKMRQKIMEVACEFRRKPLPEGEKGVGGEPFVNVIPHVGPDNHELYVMNHWLFNDGTLRYCWIRDDCDIVPIDLGSTDPIWVRTNDMYAICERMIQTMERYTAKFTDLIKARTSGNLREYFKAQMAEGEGVWVLHNRLSHCRTAGTVPLGMSKWFGDMIDRVIGPDVLKAPKEPLDMIAFDPYEQSRERHEITFLPLIIVMESKYDAFADRQMFRSIINSKHWFPDMIDSMSRHLKLFFVVAYHEKAHDWNAKLHAELYEFDDMILVDPHNKNLPISSEAVISQVLYRGILKILKSYDSRFMSIVFSHNVFFHVRNFFYLLNVASGQVLFNKEFGVRSLLITHKTSDAALEERIVGKLGPHHTIFQGNGKQQFVIFTRNNLGPILGVKSEIDVGGQPDFVFEFTSKPDTASLVLSRIPPVRGETAVISSDPPGLEATTSEYYRFWSVPFGASSLKKFTDRAGFSKYSSACVFESPKLDIPWPEIENRAELYGLPKNSVTTADDIQKAVLHLNITAVWDVPCKPAFWELFAACETIPVMWVK